MAVPTRITDFSTTAASNFPAGSEAVGTSLDDYLRAYQAVVALDLSSKGADISSAATTDLGAVGGLSHDITGTTTITSFGTVRAGVLKILKFEGALTLTHNSTSLILPGAANITTADGDVGVFISEGSGNWRCVSYFPAGREVYGNYFQADKNGTDQTGITNASTTKITFTNEVADSAALYDDTNSKFTPAAGGRWLIRAQVGVSSNASNTAGIYQPKLYKNGSLYRAGNTVKAGGSGICSFEVAAVVEGNGTDYYEVYLSVSNLSANATVSGTTSDTWFEAIQV